MHPYGNLDSIAKTDAGQPPRGDPASGVCLQGARVDDHKTETQNIYVVEA